MSEHQTPSPGPKVNKLTTATDNKKQQSSQGVSNEQPPPASNPQQLNVTSGTTTTSKDDKEVEAAKKQEQEHEKDQTNTTKEQEQANAGKGKSRAVAAEGDQNADVANKDQNNDGKERDEEEEAIGPKNPREPSNNGSVGRHGELANPSKPLRSNNPDTGRLRVGTGVGRNERYNPGYLPDQPERSGSNNQNPPGYLTNTSPNLTPVIADSCQGRARDTTGAGANEQYHPGRLADSSRIPSKRNNQGSEKRNDKGESRRDGERN